MPKNILQDVVPRGERRSIRQIPISRSNQEEGGDARTRRGDKAENYSESLGTIEYSHIEEDTIRFEEAGGGGHSRWLIWLIGAICAGFLIYVLGNFFSGATLSVTPKSQVAMINQSFTAKPNAPTGSFSYKPYSLLKDKDAVVSADGEKFVEARASGKIIIYNNYSSTAQRLVKNTRFETPDGLIYKISDSVTVPGRHTVSGQIVPGSIEVTVAAESTGPDYNIGLTDFTIPGFKSNSSRYSAFYARSKTTMTGGRSGMEKYVSDAKLKETRSKLDSDLRVELLAEARANMPTDSLFYDSAYRISFEPINTTASSTGGNSVTVRERARLTAYFIKRADLAQAVAGEAISDFNNVPVILQGDDKLVFKLLSKDLVDATIVGPIDFSLKGSATIIWQIDREKISASLAGKNKKEVSAIVATFPAVFKADAVIRPFWKSVFPKSQKSIKIKVEVI